MTHHKQNYYETARKISTIGSTHEITKQILNEAPDHGSNCEFVI